MKVMPVEQSVGLVLCHDITEIVPGVTKGPAFRRGHVVREEDIPVLKRIGKEHLYVWDADTDMVHENDAALRIAQATAGDGLTFDEPMEGKIVLKSAYQGLLVIDLPLLEKVNSLEHVTVATIQTMQHVNEDTPIAGTRVIPLAVPEKTVLDVEALCTKPLFSVLPYKTYRIGLIITGAEVFHGRIKDGFSPILTKRIEGWGSEVILKKIVPDETAMTVDAINEAITAGANLVFVTGGMSVDPDDKTPAAITSASTEVITYGSPVYPGAMFMLAYREDIPIMGLPGGVIYSEKSILNMVMPRILAGMKLTKHDIILLGHGGLCTG